MKITNLFRYATGELSQDAFLCWLLSHATAEGYDSDIKIRECAIDFMNKILITKNIEWTSEMRITAIVRQYKKIDILVVIDNLFIIIEDKTFTNSHNNQINRYKEALTSNNYYNKEVDPNNVICVYYKIIEQPQPESNVDFEFTRGIILGIFEKYKNVKTNSIFSDYLEYLEDIDAQVNSFQIDDIINWNDNAYRGFFEELGNTFLKDMCYGWGNVSNKGGGFMGLWWKNILCDTDFRKMKIDESLITDLYLQIENDKIAVKYSVANITNPDHSKVKTIMGKIFNYLDNEPNINFNKKPYRKGKYMTVGYVEYNKDNCVDNLKKLQEMLKEMTKHIRFGKDDFD